MEKLFVIFFFILMLLFQNYIKASYFSPASVYMYWSICLLLGSSFFAYSEYEWQMWGCLWWLLSALIFFIGGLIGERFIFHIKINKFFRIYDCIDYKHLLKIYFIMGVLYSVQMLANNGFSLLQIFDFNNLIVINNYMQAERYGKGDLNESLFQQICLSFAYALPLCCGYLYPLIDKIGKIKTLISFFPSIMITLLNNTKAGLIFSLLLYCTGILISYVNNIGKPKISIKLIVKLIVVLLIFNIVMLLAIKLRYYEDTGRNSIEYILIVLKDYIFGCTVNFDHYFLDIPYMDLSVSYDFNPGSNILTANTFWINSYGYIGTWLIWFFRGLLSGYAYKQLMKKKADLFEVLILIYSYINALYFFIYIPFSYTTVSIGVFIIFPIFYVKYNDKNLWFCKIGGTK